MPTTYQTVAPHQVKGLRALYTKKFRASQVSLAVASEGIKNCDLALAGDMDAIQECVVAINQTEEENGS